MTEATPATAIPRTRGSTHLVWMPAMGAAVSIALGFQSTDTRVLVHSLLACAFSGAFTIKVLAVRMPAFAKSLSAREIGLVVEYTRTL